MKHYVKLFQFIYGFLVVYSNNIRPTLSICSITSTFLFIKDYHKTLLQKNNDSDYVTGLLIDLYQNTIYFIYQVSKKLNTKTRFKISIYCLFNTCLTQISSDWNSLKITQDKNIKTIRLSKRFSIFYWVRTPLVKLKKFSPLKAKLLKFY